jgi:hypothetical protein
MRESMGLSRRECDEGSLFHGVQNDLFADFGML